MIDDGWKIPPKLVLPSAKLRPLKTVDTKNINKKDEVKENKERKQQNFYKVLGKDNDKEDDNETKEWLKDAFPTIEKEENKVEAAANALKELIDDKKPLFEDNEEQEFEFEIHKDKATESTRKKIFNHKSDSEGDNNMGDDNMNDNVGDYKANNTDSEDNAT